MNNSSVPEKLLYLEGFQEQLRSIIIQSVKSQFSSLYSDNTFSKEKPIDWSYMLLCASILSKSELGKCQDAALRIAQYCLTSQETNTTHRIASAVILDTLTNSPAIQLAISRGYLPEDFISEIPVPLRLDTIQRRIKYSLLGVDKKELLPINRFQLDIYQQSDEFDWISFSAPTSIGKSFILLHIVKKYFEDNNHSITVYLVPTRALIQQVELDMSQAFKTQGRNDVIISSIPILPNNWRDTSLLYIFTQERLQWLFNDAPTDFAPNLVIIDEAQKIGDGARGVLLQQVIEEIARRAPSVKILFSSPMTDNPEILLEQAAKGHKTKTIVSEQIAVNQNLIWVSQVSLKPLKWNIDLCLGEDLIPLGKFELPYRPTHESKRQPLIAYTLADKSGGNLIYVNGPADAEKTALILKDLQGDTITKDTEIIELTKLVRKVINKNYSLALTLERGIGFHYGNMPLLIRTEIERLFREGKIRFLVCTSTLMEGVNLPAKSIFIRGPKKGQGKPMGEIDFWNLAGRAGRQGKEFQGNVICIDPNVPKVWKEQPPRLRRRYPIRRTIDEVVEKDSVTMLKFIENNTPRNEASARPEIESAFVYFLSEHLRYNSLENSPISSLYDKSFIAQLTNLFKNILDKIEFPKGIIYKNPGISPLAQQDLLNYFKGFDRNLDELIPALPESNDAVENYTHIVGRISKFLSGDPHILNKPHAILIVNWMRGYTLARIIDNNWKHWKEKGKKNLPTVIRDTMRDVEEFVRFKFAKYSSCYVDLLRFYFQSIDKPDLIKRLPQLNIWLEFGASQDTQISLMGLGLSRTSAIAVSEFISNDNLSPKECLKWLNSQNFDSLNISIIIIDEIKRIIKLFS